MTGDRFYDWTVYQFAWGVMFWWAHHKEWPKESSEGLLDVQELWGSHWPHPPPDRLNSVILDAKGKTMSCNEWLRWAYRAFRDVRNKHFEAAQRSFPPPDIMRVLMKS